MDKSDPPEQKKMTVEEAGETMRLANIIYFRSQVYMRTWWMGVSVAKCPLDLWVYQEMMHRLSTDLLIETGTMYGGSALYFAHLFDVMGRGKVITVDIEQRKNLPQHPRIEYLIGSSVDPGVLDQVRERSSESNSVMVVLDSDHRAPYKLQELECYAPMVTPASYIIAEDSGFDYYPSWQEFGPGPAAAADVFVKRNEHFEVDRSLEKHMITFAPRAFIKRLG